MISNFQIQLYSHTNRLPEFNPCAAQVADFIENSPLTDSLQHTELEIGLKRIGIVRINCSWIGSTSGYLAGV